MAREVPVSDWLVRKAALEGVRWRRWLDELGDLIEWIERAWDLRVGAVIDGGTASLIAEADTADGTPAVLKLAMPAEGDGWDALEREVPVLRLVDGRGCARVLRYDGSHGAALLERLGRQLADLELPITRQMEVICSTLQRLWAVPERDDLPSGAEKGRFLADAIARTWEALDHPCSERVAAKAIEFANRRADAFDIERAVLVHGDAHAWNTLEAGPAEPNGFKFVDPDGLIAEPEYDLAIPMREYGDELLAGDAGALGRERARFLAHLTGLDVEKVWEWGFVERVSTGLFVIELGHVEPGQLFLDVAEAWALV